MTDAISQGQAAEAGMPTSGTSARATKPAPSEIKVVVDSGSSPTLISAFQPAWQAAANKTARKTKFSIRNCYCRQQILQSLEICRVSFAGRESCAGLRPAHNTGVSAALHRILAVRPSGAFPVARGVALR